MTPNGSRSWFYVLLFVGAVGAATVGMLLLITSGALEPAPPPLPPVSAVEQLQPPAPRSQGFVGSEACAECHQEVAEVYATHPMANSCSSASLASRIEGGIQADFTGPDHRRYRTQQSEEGRITHHELLEDDEGLIYDQSVEIAYVLGSGRHGRAYLHENAGMLFQSPLTWYSQEAKWDLSPGYDPRSHERFDRRIGDGCLYCHVGRVASDRPGPDRFGPQAFAEAAIGCERCHGPGQEHITLRRGGDLQPNQTDPIVNPAGLEPDRRDAVCFSCHLQGRLTLRQFGRGFFDFRPGDRIEDTLLVYLDGERPDADTGTLPVSQVEQMMVSRCYQASGGEFGCISCHDPHSIPSAENRVAFYRDRCLSCHETEACFAPASERNAPAIGDSCIACHMPPLPAKAVAHTSLTDHRVIRKPRESAPHVPASDPARFALFGDEASLEPLARDRGRGLLLVEAAQGMQSPALAEAAFEKLVPSTLRQTTTNQIADSLANDPAALDGMATALWLLERRDDAVLLWRKVVESEPQHERGLHYLALAAELRGDFAEALRWIDQLMAAAPNIAQVHARRAQLLARLGRSEDAIQAAQQGLTFDPTMHSLRLQLANLHLAAGQPELAAQQQRLAERIRRAMQMEAEAR